MKKVFCLVIVLAISLILGSCSGFQNSVNKPAENFYIYLIEGDHVDELPYDYSDKKWIDFIKNAELKNVFISDSDIENFDWSKQQIKLNETASLRIKNKLSNSEKVLFNIESESSNEPINYAFEKTFVVCLNNKKEYGGSILLLASARGINYPVMHITQKDKNIILNIRPRNGLFIDDYRIDKDDIMNIDEIKTFFQGKNKLINY